MSYRDGISTILRALRRLLISPSVKQKEAYARYCPTMSAAALIGTTTVFFSDAALTTSAVVRGVGMLVVSVILLFSGTLLNAEE